MGNCTADPFDNRYFIHPINNSYLKLVVLSFEDDVKHADMESNSAANKIYLTV